MNPSFNKKFFQEQCKRLGKDLGRMHAHVNAACTLLKWFSEFNFANAGADGIREKQEEARALLDKIAKKQEVASAEQGTASEDAPVEPAADGEGGPAAESGSEQVPLGQESDAPCGREAPAVRTVCEAQVNA